MTSSLKLASTMSSKHVPLYFTFKTGMVCFSDDREGPLFVIKLGLVAKIELE